MFCNISSELHDPVLRQILSYCIFDNSTEGIEIALKKYPGEKFYGWFDNDIPVAVCGFRVSQTKVEICHIAVAENACGKGFGSKVVAALRKKYNTVIEAETDDGAVDFYRKCGFGTTAIYKEYEGKPYRRWKCALNRRRQN